MKMRRLALITYFVLAGAILFCGNPRALAQKQDKEKENSIVQAGNEETKKTTLHRRHEAKQRLAEAIKKRDPKLAEAAAKIGLLAQPGESTTAMPLDVMPLAGNTLPSGINPAIDLSLPNWSYSPNLEKFVDSLPGLGFDNRNNLGQFIPVAVPDVNAYPGSDYYEIGLKDYTQRMHSNLPTPGTKLRGYYQINSTDPNVTAQQYLGPLIIAKRDRPVRVKFINQLGTGAAGDLFVPVDTTLMGAGMGPVMIMPMSADRVGGAGATVQLMTMQNHNLQVGTLVMLEGFLPDAYNGKYRVSAVPSMMSFRIILDADPGGPATVVGHVMEMYSENRADLHLHGGLTPWISDGTPHQWVTPVGEPTQYKKGASFQNVPDMTGPGKTILTPAAGDGIGTYYYPNQQSSRLMFYHDHSYGITRLNVYAGEAAGYLVVDQVEDDLIDGNNVSGVFNNIPGGPRPILPNIGGVYRYGIPLIIQDKSFVNDATTNPDPNFAATGATATAKTLAVDPLWYTHIPGSKGGDLWFPHEYLPNENIFDPNGFWLYGRWDYGPWILPPMFPLKDVLPSPSHAPEAFMDTMTVNGTAFPYLELPPVPVRFRILNACNDRMLNLQLYKADPCNPSEVRMVDAAPNAAFPTWPKDGRDGGVPDPTFAGPNMIQIGNECGFLAKVAIVPPQPVDYDYDRTSATFGNVSSTALWLAPAVRADVIVDLSQYTEGDTLILYTDAPAPMSLYDGRYDLFYGQQDWTWKGGPPAIAAGFGPNTRTIMQIRIKGLGTGQPFDINSLEQALPKAFAVGQDQILVPESAFNAAYGTNYPDTFARIADESMNITGTPQGVAKIMTELPGFNYTALPSVRIYPVGPGGGATAVASLNGVTGIVLLTSGSGYTSTPLVQITRAVGDTPGINATAEAIMSGGVVTTVVITNPGSNYLIAPTVTLSGGAGTVQATAQAIITLGSVGAITVTNPGSGYTRPPLVYLVGGGGTGAIAGALLTGSLPFNGKIMVEGMDMDYGRMNAILGSIPNPLNPTKGAGPIVGGNFYIDPPTEIYNDGELSLWRLTHLGVDSHSMHFHLVNVQVLNRVDWTNTIKAPFDEEIGWKETIRTAPFEDIILAMKPVKMNLPFGIPESSRLLDPTMPLGSTAMFNPVLPPIGIPTVAQLSNVMTNFGWEYVWHCHLLGHEENDMMRPFVMNVATTAPTAPSLAVPTQATGVVGLSWTDPTPVSNPSTMGNPSNEIGFRVERAPGTTGGTFTVIANIAANTTTYSDNTSVPGQTYRYRIVIFNAAGTATSNTMTITVQTQVPAAPSNAAATMSAQPPLTITVTWTDNSSNETGFAIQRATNSSFTSGVVNYSAPANATSFLNTGTFTMGTTYYYRVRSLIGTSPSAWSNTASRRIVIPSDPTNLSATPSAPTANPLTITLNWTDNSTAEGGFTVQRATNSTFTANVMNFTAPANPAGGATSYVDNSVVFNTTYFYRVRAFNGAGTSTLWTNTVSSAITVAGPTAPTNLTATPSLPTANPLTITLGWTDNANDETGFTIQRATDSGFTQNVTPFTAPPNAAGGATTFVDNTVVINTTYYYRVQAVKGDIPSGWSNTASATVSNVLAVVIVDNGQAGTSSTGTWLASAAPGFYGTGSLYGWGGATYRWSFTPTTTATYRVSLRWTALASRYTAVPVAITNAGTTANVTVNQTQNGGMWNVLGQWPMTAGTTYSVTITAVPASSPPSTSADAARFEQL